MPCFACACEMYWKSSSISLRKEGHVVLTSSPLNWQQRFARPFVLVLSGCRVAEAPVSVGKTVQHGCDGWIPVLCFRQNDPKDIARWLMLLTLLSEWPWHQKWAANISEPIRKRPLKRVQTPGRLASKAGSLEDLEEGRRPLQNFHHIVAFLIQIHAPIRFKVSQKWDFLNHALTSFDNLTKKKTTGAKSNELGRKSGLQASMMWCGRPEKSLLRHLPNLLQHITSNQSIRHRKESIIRRPKSAWLASIPCRIQALSKNHEKSRFPNPRSKQPVYGCQIQNGGEPIRKSKIHRNPESKRPFEFFGWPRQFGWPREVTSMISRAPSGRKHRNSN